jgi:hypothetical protein
MRRADFSDQDMTAQWRKLQVINFSKECCPNAMRRRQAVDVCRPQARRFNPAGLVFSSRRIGFDDAGFVPTSFNPAGLANRDAHRCSKRLRM